MLALAAKQEEPLRSLAKAHWWDPVRKCDDHSATLFCDIWIVDIDVDRNDPGANETDTVSGLRTAPRLDLAGICHMPLLPTFNDTFFTVGLYRNGGIAVQMQLDGEVTKFVGGHDGFSRRGG